MKYGLVIYKDTDNIGDDILSYAASCFLPQIDYIIDREQLDIFAPNKKEIVSVIMNGWFLYHKSHWPPSPYINPLFAGIHFSDKLSFGIVDSYLDGVGAEYLKMHEPIGCRDDATLHKMQIRNIQAYFSGCLTLTLNKFQNVQKNNKYILVDVPKTVHQKVLNNVDENQVEMVSHDVDKLYNKQDWSARRNQVEILLKKYQGAKVVITTRLHCALPCLALGTPVILLINDNVDTQVRMNSFKKYVHNCTVEEFLNDEIAWKESFSNSNKFLGIRNQLIDTCTIFIEDTKKNVDQKMLKKLPDLDTFIQVWKKPTQWQRNLPTDAILNIPKSEWDDLICSKQWLENQIVLKNNRIHELEVGIDELQRGKQWLEEHSKKQEEYIGELKKWLEELEKGKQWLEEHCEQQEKYINKLKTNNSTKNN